MVNQESIMTEHPILLNPIAVEITHQIYPPALQQNAAQVWLFSFEDLFSSLEKLKNFLTTDEIMRAYQFKFERDQERFIMARGILRKLLATYLNQPAEKIELIYEKHGKPLLADASLEFNLSHTQHFVLIGVSHGCSIGVDIEFSGRRLDCLAIADRYFSQKEYQDLLSTTAENRANLFFYYWVLREALLKMSGEGIAGNFDKIAIDRAKAIMTLNFPLPYPNQNIVLIYSNQVANYPLAIALTEPCDQLKFFSVRRLML